MSSHSDILTDCVYRASLSLIVYSLTYVTPIIQAKDHGAWEYGEFSVTY